MTLRFEIRKVENGFIITVEEDNEYVAENREAVGKVISNQVEETFNED